MSVRSLKVSGIVLLVVGLLLVAGGLLAGFLLPAAVYSGVQDALLVTKAEPDKEAYQHWQNNNYEDATPYYRRYTFFNLTNQAAVQATGAIPSYSPVGPYVYRYYTTKENVEFPNDGDEVKYQLKYDYHYVPEMSGDGLDPTVDRVSITNIPYFGVINGAGSEFNLWCSLAGGAFAQMLYLGMLPNYRYPAIASLLPGYIDAKQSELIQTIATDDAVSIGQATLEFFSIFANDTTDPSYSGFTNTMRLSVNASTGLSLEQVEGLLAPNSSISVTNPDAYETWFLASIGNAQAVAGIMGALGLTTDQFTAIMQWRVRFSGYATPLMLAEKGLASVDDIAIYQWATGNFSNVDPLYYLGRSTHIEFAVVAPAFGYSGVLSLASAKLILLGSLNLTSATNIGTFMFLNSSGSAAPQAMYQINVAQQYALAAYMEYFIGTGVVGPIVAPANFFRTETVFNWLWNTTDPLIATILGQQVYTNFFDNDTLPAGSDTLKTGKSDIDQIKQYVAWQDISELPDTWRTPQPVEGTDATNFKPLLSKTDQLIVWVEDLLRPVNLIFLDTMDLFGITLYRYILNPDGFAVNDNFYQSIEGFGNMTSDPKFSGAPIFLSKPNFLDADPAYLDKVEGLSPDRENDDIFLDVEPISGATMRAYKRLQLNAYVGPEWTAKFNKFNKAIPSDTFYPILIVDQRSELTEKQADDFKTAVYAPLFGAVVALGVGVGLGGILTIVSIILLIAFCVKRSGNNAVEMM